MYSYLVKELPQLVFATYPLELTRQGIFGHSMGGHGAMVLALRNPEIYRSCSAFAPITQPSTADWSQRAFREYLGSDKSNWREWDSVCLIEDGARIDSLLVDQGDADDFLDDGLRPQLLAEACTDANIELTLRMQPGYDHSYFFISSFMSDHMRWHAAKLSN
jgi:S-formylglutathione hydrolase